ncbi:hypothetical protein Q31b_09280 [Novipirellula aureliae]|uniref:Transposase n=1 Tax=Novipirellula aureliae TaxID=2527966 RepID=A0A5C6E9S8_9BACT|nr:hypothetical protein [Novipirellula aureliae]TWU45752.1 hypothetical protein Q31b_09280 [Novipirellula aureliae]
MTRSRRTFAAHEKAAVVKRYLVDNVPVSDLCDAPWATTHANLLMAEAALWQRERQKDRGPRS